jgi:PAS domain S-box-containing protein
MFSEEKEPNVKDYEKEFSILLENSPDLISQLDRDLRFIFVSQSVALLVGTPAADFVGKTPHDLGIKTARHHRLRGKLQARLRDCPTRG